MNRYRFYLIILISLPAMAFSQSNEFLESSKIALVIETLERAERIFYDHSYPLVNERDLLGNLKNLITTELPFHNKDLEKKIQRQNSTIGIYSLLLTTSQNLEASKHQILSILAQAAGNGTFYSAPITKKEFDDHLKGHTIGIGVELVKEKNAGLQISKISPGSPAKRSGLKRGDVILEINGRATSNLSVGESIELLRGKTNTILEITVAQKRGKEITQTNLSLKRASIPKLNELTALTNTEINMGYIQISKFSGDTVYNLITILDSFREFGIGSVCFDLRDCPGGSYVSCMDSAGLFVPADQKFLKESTRGNSKIIRSKKSEKFEFKKIYVLVNPGTQGGAELFGLVLEQWANAITFGESTSGYSYIRRILGLEYKPDSYLTIPTAEWQVLSRTTSIKKGIHPKNKLDPIDIDFIENPILLSRLK